MGHPIVRRSRHLSAAALLLGILFVISAWTPAFGDSAEASKLLQQARMSAAQLRRDTTSMETFTRSQLSWQSHAHQINLIKEHINNTGKVVADLHNARDGAEAWQQDAIDHITPLLQEIASNTEAIINHLNENRGHTWHPEYEGYVRSNAELANDLSKLIGDYIDYGGAKSRAQSLEQKLGFSGQ
ncbi:MAG: hypothetical protein KGM47_07345 [Acidobacteriota bacterium]|nr:hypothetical protein [Acidobacteriota bacterium]